MPARCRIDEARRELHRLLENPELATTPVLVLANKIDLQPHIVRRPAHSLWQLQGVPDSGLIGRGG